MEILRDFFKKKSPSWHTLFFVIILAYYAFRLLFFATSISPSIPPDEKDRIELSILYSQYPGWTLPDTPATYHLGIISRRPNLYFRIMGWLLRLNVFSVSPILFLRLINIGISLATVLLSYKFFHLLSNNRLVSLLGVIVLTNIPMYSFLGAFVSYDNLTNFWAILSFYFLFKFLKKYKVKHLYLLAISTLLGALTKHVFLPFLLIFPGILIIDFLLKKKEERPRIPSKTLYNILLPCLIIFLVILNACLYLVNIIQYRHIIPKCTQILTIDQCREKENFRVYEALKTNAQQLPKESFLKPYDYFFYWRNILERGIFGIFGHRLMFRTSRELLTYNLLFLFFLITLIRKIHYRNKIVFYCFLISLVYAGILFYFVNYQTYLKTRFLEAALQGRYLFPVIFPIVFLFTHTLMDTRRKALKTILFAIICIIFIVGDFPYFLKFVNRSWYLSSQEYSSFMGGIPHANGNTAIVDAKQ